MDQIISLCQNITSPPFGAPVLEPGFDLSVGHLQSFGKSCPLSRRQVLLPVEPLLELADLQPGKRSPGLLLLWRRPVLVRMTYATCHSEGWEGHWRGKDRAGQERRRTSSGKDRTGRVKAGYAGQTDSEKKNRQSSRSGSNAIVRAFNLIFATD